MVKKDMLLTSFEGAKNEMSLPNLYPGFQCGTEFPENATERIVGMVKICHESNFCKFPSKTATYAKNNV